MVGLAAICWTMWIARDKACFEAKITKSSTEVLCSTSALISYWAGLQKKEDDRENLEAGAGAL
jgi:hypothetical protein